MQIKVLDVKTNCVYFSCCVPVYRLISHWGKEKKKKKMLTKDSSSMKAGGCTEPAWYQIKLSVVTMQSPTSTVMPKHADTAKKAIQYTVLHNRFTTTRMGLMPIIRRDTWHKMNNNEIHYTKWIIYLQNCGAINSARKKSKTLRRWVIFEKLPIPEFVNIFPTFYKIQRFITVFIKAYQFSLYSAMLIQFRSFQKNPSKFDVPCNMSHHA